MSPLDENAPEQERPAVTGESDLLSAEQELLAKARETSQRITKRVRRALEEGDDPCPARAPKENPPSE